MYNKLPVKERIELMKSYRKANKDMSYRDMVKDYNDSYEKFDNGGYKSEAEYKAHLLDPYSAEKRTAQIAWLNNNKPLPYSQRVNNEPASDNDSWLENVGEIIDPTGISSWDDVHRAYKNKGIGKETALESLGSIPLLGKVSKVTKPGIHLTKYTGLDAILKNTLPKNKSLSRAANVTSKVGRGTDAVQAVLGAKDDSGFTWDIRHGEVPKYGGRNIFPQIDLGETGDFKYGGIQQFNNGGIKEDDVPKTKRDTTVGISGLSPLEVKRTNYIKYMNDPTYIERLKKEMYGDNYNDENFKSVQDEYNKRIYQIKNIPIIDNEKTEGGGYYNQFDNIIKANEMSINHEFSHAAERDFFNKDKYGEHQMSNDLGFRGELIKNKNFYKKYNTPESITGGYTSKPTEIKARINELRLNAIEHGYNTDSDFNIKKYKSFYKKNPILQQQYKDLKKYFKDKEINNLSKSVAYNETGSSDAQIEELMKSSAYIPGKNYQLPIARYGGIQKFGDGGKKNTNIAVDESTSVAKPHILKLPKDVKGGDYGRNTLNYMYAKELLKKYDVKVDSSGNVLKDIGLNSSAYYNPVTRTINYKQNPDWSNHDKKRIYTDMIMKELPHAIQADSMGVVPFLKNTFIEGAQDYLFNDDKQARYYDPSKIEGHAHNTLEQKLWEQRDLDLGAE